MRKRPSSGWVRGGLALLAGGAGGAGVALLLRRGLRARRGTAAAGRDPSRDRWARPGMAVTFRAELMPGRASAERTFRVARVLASRRVLIEGIAGEHAAAEFESKK